MSEKTKDTIDIYIDYVTDQIEKLDKFSNIIDDTSINFNEINRALANNLKVMNALNVEYQRVKALYMHEKKAFEIWYDTKYIQERNIHNSNDVTASKWLSGRELDALVKVNNEKEYLEKSERLEALEMRVNFLKRLIDSWSSYMYVLNTLSQNLRTEYFGNLNDKQDMNNSILVRKEVVNS